MKDVAGKVAFITGGTSGIGFGIAQVFIRAGMKVIIAGTSQERIAKALEHFAAAGYSSSVHAVRVNVTDRPGLERAAAEAVQVFGKIHVLVNNAGVVIPATLSRTSYENWDWLMNVNLTGVFNGVHIFLPYIQAHGEGGQIMSTSSILGLFVSGSGEVAAYSASKFALVGMMEALRAELAGSAIGVSVICPGVVNSRLEESSLRDISGDAAAAGLDSELMERTKRVREDPNLSMGPLEMGELVLRGMRNNDLYILTHPEFEQVMRDRSEALLASLPRDRPPSAERLEMAHRITQKSIYRIVTLLKRNIPGD
jgi:NAD(P)-dependent dehydrogenase (short-subunit alcohol dehydrogenase family)